MNDLTQLRIDDFLDQLADRAPTPGGGAVAALTGTLASALARMVAAYSIGPRIEPALRNRLEPLAAALQRADALLRPLLTADAQAFEHLQQQSKAARATGDAPAAEAGRQGALLVAVGVPMQVVALTAGALERMEALLPDANRYLLSDLGAAAVLADAAAGAAGYMVRINLPDLPDAELRRTMEANLATALAHCSARRQAVEAGVAQRLQPADPPSR